MDNNNRLNKSQVDYLATLIKLHKPQLFLNKLSQYKTIILANHSSNRLVDYLAIFNHRINNSNLNNKDYLILANLNNHNNKRQDYLGLLNKAWNN